MAIAAPYPHSIAINIGITDKNFLNITEPNTATTIVTKNTIALLEEILSPSAGKSPALLAAVAANSKPINATTGPIAAGGNTTSIQSEPNLYIIKDNIQPQNPTATNAPKAY